MIRSRGHGFSRASGARRCSASCSAAPRELGVELRFEHEVGGSRAAARPTCVVGADGVNCARAPHARRVRAAHRPPTRRASPGSAPTSRSTRSRSRSPETEHGVFQAHALSVRRRARARSSSRRARTRGGGPGSTARRGGEPRVLPRSCSRDVLDGRQLLSNRSLWLALRRGPLQRDWQRGQRRAAGRRRAHRALLDRLGHEARDGGRDRAGRRARRRGATLAAALVELRARAPAGGRALPGGGAPERRVLRGGPALLGAARRCSSRSTCSPAAGGSATPNLSLRDPRLVAARSTRSLGGRGALAPPPLFAPLELRGLGCANRAVVGGVRRRRRARADARDLAVTRRRADHARRRPDRRPPRLARRRRDRPRARAARRCSRSRTPAGAAPAGRASEGVDLPLREGGWPLVSRLADALRAAAAATPARARRGGHGARSATRSWRRPRRGGRGGLRPRSSSTWATATCSARSSRR